jgi:hypothetical protein
MIYVATKKIITHERKVEEEKRMNKNQIMSVAIAFSMLAVSFAMVVDNVMGVSMEDSNTTLTVNAKFPKLYWIGFNLTDGPVYTSRMGVQVPVVNPYIFSLEYNYSFGSALCDFTVQAWYDRGAAPSVYPAPPTNDDRNLAFQLDCTNAGAVTVTYPSGNLEVTTPGVATIQNWWSDVLYPGQEVFRVYIPVNFGPQLRAGDVDGYGTYDQVPASALITMGTWDFSVTVRDTSSSANNVSYGEFGIQRFVNVAVTGDPTGNAPPGGSTDWMGIQSQITYSSNFAYTVIVEIDDLVDPLNPLTPILATNVEVQNMHANATGNSGIDAPTFFVGPRPGNMLYVWGAPGVPIAASNHGTTSIGPLDSNFFGAETTNLRWRVGVPGGTGEGVYTSTIYVTVDNT